MDIQLRRHRGKWSAAWYEGGERKRLSSGLDATPTNRAAAEEWCQNLTRASAYDETPNCDAIMQRYIADLGSKPGAKTAGFYWVSLARHFQYLLPENVTRDACRKYQAIRRQENKSESTIRSELGYLRSALRWNDKNTPAQFDMPAQAPPRDAWLTKQEVRHLLAHAQGHIKLFIHLAIATGARREAILELRWDPNIDWELGYIRLGVKPNGKARATVPINATVRRALKAAQPSALTPFVIEYGGKPIRDVKTGLGRTARRAGLMENVGAHMFRHSAAIWMTQEGVPMSKISQYLGHANTRITEQVYARYQPDFLVEASAALDLGADDEPSSTT